MRLAGHSCRGTMKLALHRIQELASREGVSRIIVENFLSSMDDLNQAEALANLELDAKIYKWSTATGRAIQQGVMEATTSVSDAVIYDLVRCLRTGGTMHDFGYFVYAAAEK